MKICKEIHKPYFYENKGSTTIVIFIHGILESPNQFREFTKIVHEEGYSYSAVLLDGHGKNGKDFANSSKNKWIESVDEEILKYKDKYENIILVGHSMGSLLSIISTLKYKDNIKGLVLISAPLKVFVRVNIMVSSVKIAFGKIKEGDTLTNHAYKAFSVDRCSLLTYLSWIPRYKDLFKLIFITRKELDKLEVPLLIISAKNDELVSNKSLKVFNKSLSNDYDIVNLEKSGHFYYDERELIRVLKEFKLFLNKIIN